MTTYAIIKTETLIVEDIFSCEDINTFGGYELPNYDLMLKKINDYNPLPTIGMSYNPETGQFS